jgi:uroporphyrinogen decarboxylase
MTLREKYFKAVRREDGSYIPYSFSLCESLHEQFTEKTGSDDYASYYQFPMRFAGVPHLVEESRFTPYLDSNDLASVNEWGVGSRPGSVAHFTSMVHPMKNLTTLDEFKAYPYPHPINDFNWDTLFSTVEEIQNNGLIAVGSMQMTIFETAWYMRGMDAFMMDMMAEPELAEYHLDRITEIRCEMAKRYALAGADELSLGDDVSTQLDMMMSPELWRDFLKPRLSRVIQSAKSVKPDILIFYHGDGNLQKIIPDLIEIGVQILNPVQPECMDPLEIMDTYWHSLTLNGTIGTQTTMPFGSPGEVKEACCKMCTAARDRGGLVLAPTHLLEPEVPWDNIEAFIDTVKEFNNTEQHPF